MTPAAAFPKLKARDPLLSPVAHVTIGKDVLELVSTAMYVDPMTIYREYVQNAADAIDEARRTGQLVGPGVIDISFDTAAAIRSIRIRDNGVGLAWPRFTETLTAIGGSAKRGTKARGFRGVGRLAGLGFAQEVIFRSRVDGEDNVSELRWDCRRLKAALREPRDTGVEDLIREIVTSRQLPAADYPQRFFEVELKGVVRQGGDRLMSAHAVEEYLAQVAPVPFSPDFSFSGEIATILKSAVNLETINIHVAGGGLVYRPHRDAISAGNERDVVFETLRFVEVPGVDGGIAAVAWFLHHDYAGALPNSTLVKGLRLRSGNIQVGDHTQLEGLFPEPRFNVWSVGEIHVLDPRLIPNGRRDNFEQNIHLTNLHNHLAPMAKEIARRCRTSSARRKWLREFDVHRQIAAEKLRILAQGSLPTVEREAVAASIEHAISRMTQIRTMDALLDTDASALEPAILALREEANAASAEFAPASPLSHLTAADREMYEGFFALIYECSANRTAAKALIDRIIRKLSN